jgi:hypothetical protein
MFRSTRLKTIAVPLIALGALFTLACPRAEAQVIKPFKVTGGGVAPRGLSLVLGTPTPHWAVGNATGLGKYYSAGAFQLLKFTSPTTADFSSSVPCVFVAANGDKLVCTYGDTTNGAKQAGKVTLTVVGVTANKTPIVTGTFVAEFNPVPALCTGRFNNVVGGSFIMVAVTQPFVLGATDPVGFTWAGKGSLAFSMGK